MIETHPQSLRASLAQLSEKDLAESADQNKSPKFDSIMNKYLCSHRVISLNKSRSPIQKFKTFTPKSKSIEKNEKEFLDAIGRDRNPRKQNPLSIRKFLRNSKSSKKLSSAFASGLKNSYSQGKFY